MGRVLPFASPRKMGKAASVQHAYYRTANRLKPQIARSPHPNREGSRCRSGVPSVPWTGAQSEVAVEPDQAQSHISWSGASPATTFEMRHSRCRGYVSRPPTSKDSDLELVRLATGNTAARYLCFAGFRGPSIFVLSDTGRRRGGGLGSVRGRVRSLARAMPWRMAGGEPVVDRGYWEVSC